MSVFGRKFAGSEALCEYYPELGMGALILPDNTSEAEEQGFIKHERGYNDK